MNGLLVAFALVAAASLGACGGSGSDQAAPLTYSGYFESFGFDYEPVSSLDELAERSDLVTRATLVDVVDGPVYGKAPDDAEASRFSAFVFATSGGAKVRVVLPRPNTVDSDEVRAAMPLGAAAVLYLEPMPTSEVGLWHQIDEPLWLPVTPLGLVMERVAGDPTTAETPMDVSEGERLRQRAARADAIGVDGWLSEHG